MWLHAWNHNVVGWQIASALSYGQWITVQSNNVKQKSKHFSLDINLSLLVTLHHIYYYTIQNLGNFTWRMNLADNILGNTSTICGYILYTYVMFGREYFGKLKLIHQIFTVHQIPYAGFYSQHFIFTNFAKTTWFVKI